MSEKVDMEVEGEQQSSAWIEQTSSGKLKFGLKCYKLDVGTAVDDVVREFIAFKKQINIIEGE